MSPPRQAYRGGTFLLSVLMVVIGLALVIKTLALGGGGLTYGILFGTLFMAAGAARLWLLRRT
jgi:hypothetical protein